MIPHLGFTIPLGVTFKQGARHSHPGPGVCAECGTPRARCYQRFDEKPYCAACIIRDLDAVVVPDDDVQRHPDTMPREIPYEYVSAQGGTDDFEVRAVAAGPHPDPRMYDRALA